MDSEALTFVLQKKQVRLVTRDEESPSEALDSNGGQRELAIYKWIPGWWLTYPSEKYESVGSLIPNVWQNNMFQTTKRIQQGDFPRFHHLNVGSRAHSPIPRTQDLGKVHKGHLKVFLRLPDDPMTVTKKIKK